jgi:D-alanyl-D-alanine carboxypeptidase
VHSKILHSKTLFRRRPLGFFVTALALSAAALVIVLPLRTATAMAVILVDADSGKVLRADNATYPWYPASTTKMMTL